MSIESLEVFAAVSTDLGMRARQFAETRLAPLGGIHRLDEELVEQKIEEAVAGILHDLRQWAVRLEVELAPLYADICATETELEFQKEEARPQGSFFGLVHRLYNWYFRIWPGIRANEARVRELRRKLERDHQVRLLGAITMAGIRQPNSVRYAELLRQEMSSL